MLVWFVSCCLVLVLCSLCFFCLLDLIRVDVIRIEGFLVFFVSCVFVSLHVSFRFVFMCFVVGIVVS